MIDIRPIGAADLQSARAEAAFRIYEQAIDATMREPLERIHYWVAHCEPGQFNCFSVHFQDRVVGYIQYSYSASAEVLLFEYLCLDNDNLAQPIGPEAMVVVRNYLIDHYPLSTTVVLEVAAKGEDKADTGRMAFFARHGFRRCPFPYICPALRTDFDAGVPADLMAWMPEGNGRISAERFLAIVRHIYSNHYLRSERPFLDDGQFTRREQQVERLYDRLRQSILTCQGAG